MGYSMRRKLDATHILAALKALLEEGLGGASSSEIHTRTGGSYATVGRLLDKLVHEHVLVRKGKARATRYFLAPVEEHIAEAVQMADRVTATASPGWSAQARAALDDLNRALG